MQGVRTVVRVNGRNPNHHIYRNNGTYWVHYTLHLPDYTKRRERRSLVTGDLAEAQRKRDALFRELGVNLEARTAVVLPLAA